MILNPDFLSPAFQSAAAGYLSTHARDLPALLGRIASSVTSEWTLSMRERAILEAVREGVRNPARWEANRQPITLRLKPLPGADSIASIAYAG